MTRKNVCATCPTHSKEGIALIAIGFLLALQSNEIVETIGIFLIFFSYFLPFIKSKINKWGE